MTETRIIGLLITDRIKEAGRTQKVLSDYAHIIRTRLGFHELSQEKNSRTGIILLHLNGKKEEWDLIEKALRSIGGIELQIMNFVY